MASKLKIKVNGLVHNVTASLDTPLLYVLHNELHLHGPRFGCGLAQCGACSVLLDGKEIRSCVTPVAAVSGKAITTLEGMPALYAKSRGTSRLVAGCAASAAAGVDRRAGAALRLLPERNDDPGRRPAGDDQAPDRGADPHRDERPPLPLRDVSADPHGDPEGRRRDGEGWEVAMTEMLNRDTGVLAQVVPQGRRRARRRLQPRRRRRSPARRVRHGSDLGRATCRRRTRSTRGSRSTPTTRSSSRRARSRSGTASPPASAARRRRARRGGEPGPPQRVGQLAWS